MEAWQGLIARLMAEHPFFAPLIIFWWQAAFQDVLAFLRFKDVNEFATWNYRRMLLSWAQGIVGGIIGVGAAGVVTAGAGAAAGLVTVGIALALAPRIRTSGARLGALALAASLASSSCASLPVKQRATVGVQAAHTAVAAAQDSERALYAGKLAGITPQAHGRFADFFERYFTAEAKVTDALIAWRSGDPPPQSLAEAMAALREALDAAGGLTDGAEKDSLLGKINDGIARVREVLDALAGGGGGQ